MNRLNPRLHRQLNQISAKLTTGAFKAALSVFTFFVTVAITSTYPSYGLGANLCESYFEPSSIAEIPRAKISEKTYRESTLRLRATLSGKLATVWRSEWKAKLEVKNSNQYVLNLVQTFLAPSSQAFVLRGLNPAKEEFVRAIHERMYQLQQENRMAADDELLVRDPPAPTGALDRTFTYYTKPIVSAASQGKHQIRIRTYLREVLPEKLPVAQEITGYDMKGRKVVISKSAEDTFVVLTTLQDNIADVAAAPVAMIMSGDELRKKYGTPIYLFAPHGKNFKLEVKTALTDEISPTDYPLLGGPHMVQKLDMNLSMKEVAQLFAALPATLDVESQVAISLARIETIAQAAASQPPEIKARNLAVLSVLADGVRANADFLKIEGATLYHRTAFESKSGFQTTIDRDQGVFAANMYSLRGLKSPAQTMTQNTSLHTGVADARHVELKLPVTMVAPMLGIQFKIPPPTLPVTMLDAQSKIHQAIDVFYPFVQSAKHSGKFGYLLQNHAFDDH